jgi:hypothetical protein
MVWNQPKMRKKNGGDATSEMMAHMHDEINQHQEGSNKP